MNPQDCVQVAPPQDAPPPSLWPKNDENHVVPAKLWQLSTHKYTVKFINRKQLEIEYNFDRLRATEECILINVNCLLPVLGGMVSEALEEFTNIPKLCEFVGMHVHLNMCSKHQHASCPCHLGNLENMGDEAFVVPLVDTCKYRHFHHFCSEHVRYWLKYFLHFSIMRRHGCCSSEGGTPKRFVLFPDNMAYFGALDI